MKKLILVFTFVVCSGSAQAQYATTITDLSTTLSTSPQNCVPPGSSFKSVSIQNLDSTNNIGFCYRTSSVPSIPCTPSIGAKGTYTIAPGALFYWSQWTPKNGLDCIASGSVQASINTGN